MTPHPPLGTDPGLVATANQADRSKRPVVVVVIAALLLLAAVVYLASGFWTLNSAKDFRRTQLGQASQAWFVVQQIESARAKAPSAEVYRSASLTPDRLRRAAAEAWRLDTDAGDSVSDVVTIPVQPNRTTAHQSPGIEIATTAVSFTGQPLENILRFIRLALQREGLATAFVSKVELRPAPIGWTGVVEFRQYEYREGR